MTLDQLIERTQKTLNDQITARNALVDKLAELRDAETVDQEAVDGVRGEIRAADAQIDETRDKVREYKEEKARDAAVSELYTSPAAASAHEERAETKPAYDEVLNRSDVKEPRTYSRATSYGEGGHEPLSLFRDGLKASQGDMGAHQRLQRHAQEVKVHGEQSARAAGTGAFAGLVVPQYLVDEAALVLRAGRPFANLCTKLQIPEQGMAFVIPRGTTGASTSVQSAENTAVSSTDDVWANVTVPVVTGSGSQDVSRQLLERGTPGIDQLIYTDLVRAYAGQNPGIAGNAASQFGLGWAVINGSGSSGQPLGVLNTAGIGASTAMGAAITVSNLNLKLAGGINNVLAAGLGLTPKVIVMHPRRWTWLLAQVDTTGRPVVQINTGVGFNTLAQGQPIQGLDSDVPIAGMYQGLPVVLDWNMPTTVGAANEDQIIVADTSQCLLWEDGDGMPRELSFEQTTGGSLTTKLVVYGYYAFTAGRYPAAVAKVGGADTGTNGLVAPSF